MISIIIPVYNVKPYLERCLCSVISQTYSDLEIIVIDDGSNDGSAEICDDFMRQDPRITVIHQENAGLSSARNRGLDIANGEWIAFLDSDDWIEPDMLQTLYELATNYHADISSCATINEIRGETENKHYDGLIREFCFNEMIGGLISGEFIRFEVWNKLWRRSIIKDLRFKVGQVSEDVYFDFRAFHLANKLVHINNPLHHYVVNRPGSTNTSYKKARLCIFEEFDSFMNEMKSEGNNDVYAMVAYLGIFFSKKIYEEAVLTHQDDMEKQKLFGLFKKYYRIKSARQYRPFKGRISWFFFPLFTISLYMGKEFI